MITPTNINKNGAAPILTLLATTLFFKTKTETPTADHFTTHQKVSNGVSMVKGFIKHNGGQREEIETISDLLGTIMMQITETPVFLPAELLVILLVGRN
ncbi:unnamed protein product [Arabis nemorensis]|uniref:Uncharacterized protein n=1 Tax=Arabis nemorensis TaxID=586526 RepID=A0A565BBU6_9BRAS|nr:unnamed protein product [Arabis nemorensis]